MQKKSSAIVCLAALLACFSSLALAQKPYFQQEVNTSIRVALDDENHTVAGDIEIEYINHSPDTLREIWMHLWANAHDSRRSALNRQFLRGGSGKLHFAKKDERGGFSGLDFSVDNQRVAWEFDAKNPDIARLALARPLPPGGKIRVATPLKLKIPASFSRLGHVGQSYQMTQWFPKPAVYDARGWHAMPYLNQGEFYSEFGRYDVSITLPENYVVGATGSLQTLSEVAFLQKKEAETRERLKQKINPKDLDFPPSAAATKTLRYTAENIHDFAWFADKRFMVVRDTARLASGRTVDCWAMFGNDGADIWPKGAFYVRRAVEYYSRRVGEYPWPQATAVLSALSAGGGMEYPMITVINDEDSPKSLDEVITHEVGHNWFYGLLASNERDHPFMDEGMNSYYEGAYMAEYYGADIIEGMVPKFLINPKQHGSLVEVGNLLLARNGLDTPPDSHSERFSQAGYGLLVYMKTAFCMRWLATHLGTEKFDAAMQDYFRKWSFRHPYPDDFQAVMRENGVDVAWFMQQMQTQQHTDYVIKKTEKLPSGETELTIKNRGEVAAPFAIAARNNGAWSEQKWYPGLSGTDKVRFPNAGAEPEAFLLDAAWRGLDVNRKNDFRRAQGLFPNARPLQVKLLAPIETPRRMVLGALPWLGWNAYDQMQAGIVFYNPPLPGQRVQYYLAPGYGFGSKNLTGLADLRLRFFPNGAVRGLTLGLSAKTFGQELYWRGHVFAQYSRVVPSVKMDFRARSTTFRHDLQLRAILLSDKTSSDGATSLKSTIYEAKYTGGDRRWPSPYSYEAAIEWHPGGGADTLIWEYAKASFTWKQRFFYAKHGAIGLRFFAGYFLQKQTQTNSWQVSDAPRVNLALSQAGYNDYKYDHVFGGRSEGSDFWSRQTAEAGGGFKYGFAGGWNDPFAAARSSDFLLALNLKADLPLKLPVIKYALKPYADFGFARNEYSFDTGAKATFEEQFFWSAGLALEFFNSNLGVYFPLHNSQSLNKLYDLRNNYAHRITWRLNLNDLEPRDLTTRLLR